MFCAKFGCNARSITIEPTLEARLRELVALLLVENQKFNLTAVRQSDEAWRRHVLDSLQALHTEVFEGEGRAVDVGSGAGFPGLPLALALPAWKWSFVEATRKKCGFIEQMSAHFELGARVVHARAEEAGRDATLRERFRVATARAVGSFSEVCELCLPFVQVGGFVLLWRGPHAEAEATASEEALDELGGLLRGVEFYQLPENEARYALVIVEKVATTPWLFPRAVGLPKRKPL